MRALVLDVDGVLTDGGIILDGEIGEWKRFHARDGVGVKLALYAGWRVLFLTARASLPAKRRAMELGAEWAIGVGDKAAFLENWLNAAEISWEETAFMGDDLQDVSVLRRVGWPLTVADAGVEVKEVARYTTRVSGGSGAVREAVEYLLTEHGLRDRVIEAFLTATEGFSVGEESHGGEPRN